MGSVQPAYAESFGVASAHSSRRSAAKAEHPTIKLNSEESCSLLLKVALVSFLDNVLCEDRSGPAPGAQAFLDQVRLPSNPVFFSTKALISDLRLHTVCESAQCPNRWECWSQGTATFMIAGDRCTRACGFCAVTTAKPFALEADEPKPVAEGVGR